MISFSGNPVLVQKAKQEFSNQIGFRGQWEMTQKPDGTVTVRYKDDDNDPWWQRLLNIRRTHSGEFTNLINAAYAIATRHNVQVEISGRLKKMLLK